METMSIIGNEVTEVTAKIKAFSRGKKCFLQLSVKLSKRFKNTKEYAEQSFKN